MKARKGLANVRKFLLSSAVGLAAIGLAAIASAFAPSTAFDTSGPVDVVDPTFDLEINLQGHVGAIPADNAYHQVDKITVIAHDPNYSYTLTTLEVIWNGSQMPIPPPLNCGSWDYRLGNGSDIENAVGFVFPGDGSNHDTLRTLHLRIDSAGTVAACKVFGGIVEATFVVGS